MATSSGLAAVYGSDRSLVEARLNDVPVEQDETLDGWRRAAAAAVVLVGAVLFMTPPAVALLVLVRLLN
jgi:hypothetical protein